MNKTFLVLFLFFTQVFFVEQAAMVHGQERIIFNPNFSSFLLNQGIYNPSAYSLNKLQLGVNYRSGLGSFSRIRDIYAEAVFREKNHTGGINFYAEQQSVLFSKSKIQGLYALKTNLSKDLELSFGAEVGLANIRFDGSSASAGGSAWGLDFSLGGLITYRKLKVGFVIQQIPQTLLQPIGYRFVLNRYYDFSTSYTFKLNDDWDWESGMIVSMNSDNFLWLVDNKVTYQKKYGALLNLQTNLRGAIGVFSEIPQLEEALSVAFTYETGFASRVNSKNTINFLIRYAL